jgi:hypothetical protein
VQRDSAFIASIPCVCVERTMLCMLVCGTGAMVGSLHGGQAAE